MQNCYSETRYFIYQLGLFEKKEPVVNCRVPWESIAAERQVGEEEWDGGKDALSFCWHTQSEHLEFVTWSKAIPFLYPLSLLFLWS